MEILSSRFRFSAKVLALTIVVLVVGGQLALAQNSPSPGGNNPGGGQPSIDTRVTAFTITPGSNSLKATTTYTVSIKTNAAIAANTQATLRVGAMMCPPEILFSSCSPDFTNAALSGGGVTKDTNSSDSQSISIMFGNGITANSALSFTISNVVNPSTSGMVGGILMLMDQTVSPGQMPQEARSTPFFIGTLAAKGKLLAQDGTVPQMVGGNLQTPDFKTNIPFQVDSTTGDFMIPDSGLTSGSTYQIMFFIPPSVSEYLSPPPIVFQYVSGQTKDLGTITLTKGSKTIVVTVVDEEGNAVTDADVFAFQPGGMGGGKNTSVDSGGKATLTVSGGSWELMVQGGFDPTTRQPKSVKWSYNEPPKPVTFANDTSSEQLSVTFKVEKTNAQVKGRVVDANGQSLQRGFVHAQQGMGRGSGTGIQNGSFTLNLKAGTYELMIMPDMGDPSTANLYFDPVTLTVKENETLDLGTIKAGKKSASISGVVQTTSGTVVEDVRVHCWSAGAGFRGWGEGTTDENGKFSVYLNEGTWECDLGRGPESKVIPERKGPPERFTLKKDEHVTGVVLTVKIATAFIKVKVTDDKGSALSSQFGFVEARPEGAGPGPGGFGAPLNQGAATIPLSAGTYVLEIHTPPDARSDYLQEKSEKVTVSDNETKEVIIKLVPPDAFIKGEIKNQAGEVIKNVNMDIFVGKEGGFFWKNTKVNPNGSYKIGVLGGAEYTLGYHFPPDSQKNVKFLQSHPEPLGFKVEAGSTVTKDMTLVQADATVAMTVLDPDAKPVKFAFGFCTTARTAHGIEGAKPTERPIESGKEIMSGKGDVPVLGGMTWECSAGLPPEAGGKKTLMPPAMQKVSVESGKTVSITVQFGAASSSIFGTAKLKSGKMPQIGWCNAYTLGGAHSGSEIFNGKFDIPVNAGTWYLRCDTDGPEGFFTSQEVVVTVPDKLKVQQNMELAKGAFDVPEGTTVTVDVTEQANIELADGTTVTIPANALGEEGNATIVITPTVNVATTATDKPLTFAVDVTALDSSQNEITSLNSQAKVCLVYEEKYLDKVGIEEEEIASKFFNDTSNVWQQTEGMSIDTKEDEVCATTTHLTNFAITSSKSKKGTASRAAESDSGPFHLVATAMSNGGPQVAIFRKNGKLVTSFFAYDKGLRMGLIVKTADLDGNGTIEVVAIPGEGTAQPIRIFNTKGKLLAKLDPYPGFKKGVNVAIDDLDGDGKKEMITVPAKEASADVKVYSSKTWKVVGQFNAYGSAFKQGAGVEAADLDGDGKGEVIVYPTVGSGQVRIFGKGKLQKSFDAYGAGFKNGLWLTVTDLTGDGKQEIITSPKDSVSTVKAWSQDGKALLQFNAFDVSMKTGAKVYAGDLDGDGKKELVALPASGVAQVRLFSSKTGKAVGQFSAFGSSIKGVWSAVVGDLTGDGKAEIAVVPGSGLGPQVNVLDKAGKSHGSFFVFDQGFRGGVNLGLIVQ